MYEPEVIAILVATDVLFGIGAQSHLVHFLRHHRAPLANPRQRTSAVAQTARLVLPGCLRRKNHPRRYKPQFPRSS
jgi:hypothetical protein